MLSDSEEAKIALYKQDSAQMYENRIDTVVNEEKAEDSEPLQTGIKEKEETDFVKEYISPLLMPNGDFSGAILLTEYNDVKTLSSLTISFLLLLVSFVCVYKRKKIKNVLFISFLQLLFLLLFSFHYWEGLLYGYWVSVGLSVLNFAVLLKSFFEKDKQAGTNL